MPTTHAMYTCSSHTYTTDMIEGAYNEVVRHAILFALKPWFCDLEHGQQGFSDPVRACVFFFVKQVQLYMNLCAAVLFWELTPDLSAVTMTLFYAH